MVDSSVEELTVDVDVVDVDDEDAIVDVDGVAVVDFTVVACLAIKIAVSDDIRIKYTEHFSVYCS